MQVREATVGPLSGTMSVLASVTWTCSTVTPKASAAIWLNMVSAPWPMSVELERTSNRPSTVRASVAWPLSRASPEPVNPEPW